MTRTENPGEKRIPWLRVVTGVLGLILLMEAICMAMIWKRSDSAAARMGEMDHVTAAGWIRGVSLRDSGSAAAVDGAFLERIAALHKTEIDAVLFPFDFAGHMDGGVIMGAWMGQAAEMMEMVYQNNYRVIVSAAISGANAMTQLAYINLWNQIDAAWGHRSASELIYELRIPLGADPGEWLESVQMILFNIREKRADRKVLLTFAPEVWAKERDAVAALASEYAIYVGLMAGPGLDADLLDDVQMHGIGPGRIVLVQPDEEARDSALLPMDVEQWAEQMDAGYLLCGD